MEGTGSQAPRAGDVARRDVPTCRMDERIDGVRERVHAAGWEVCVVVNDERVVFGLLRREELLKGSDEPVERIMRPGPSTFRPHVRIEEMAAYMTEHDLPSSPITTSDGRLVGILLKDDALEAVHRLHMHHAHIEAEDEPS
ncbi:MAG: CBS domain-containing protein [Actinomycetota bacterium]